MIVTMTNMKKIFDEFLTPYLAEDIDIRNIVHDILFDSSNFSI